MELGQTLKSPLMRHVGGWMTASDFMPRSWPPVDRRAVARGWRDLKQAGRAIAAAQAVKRKDVLGGMPKEPVRLETVEPRDVIECVLAVLCDIPLDDQRVGAQREAGHLDAIGH